MMQTHKASTTHSRTQREAAESHRPHPGLATEFSGSSRLTRSMYRAQVRIFREKLNRRILRPVEGVEAVGGGGGGVGKRTA